MCVKCSRESFDGCSPDEDCMHYGIHDFEINNCNEAYCQRVRKVVRCVPVVE